MGRRLRLVRRRRKMPLHVAGIEVGEVPFYEAEIVLSRRSPPSGLERLFLEELAEVSGEPEILALARGDKSAVTLYRREVLLGGEE
jgi:hypothetical protein